MSVRSAWRTLASLAVGTLIVIAWPALALPLAGPLQAQQGQARLSPNGEGSLHLTITGATGAKVPGASILIERQASTQPALHVSANHEGAYYSEALAPGRYRITVSAPCYEKIIASTVISAGKQAALTIKLNPAPPQARTSACRAPGRAAGSGFQFSDSGALKPGAFSGSVDAAGYSSQAQARSTELRQALDAWAAAPGQSGPGGDSLEASVFSRGSALLSQGNDPEAAEVFEKGAQRYPRSVKMLLALAVADYSLGRPEKAIDSLCRAIDLDPQSRAAHFFLARIYSASPARTGPALGRLESYAAREPQNAAAQYDYALGLWRSGEAGRSVSGKQGPSAGPAGNQKSTGGDSKGSERAEQVISLLQSAISLDPELLEARFQLGVVLAEEGRDAQAIPEFEKVVALQPGWAEAHYRLSQLYRREGEKDKAARELAAYERSRTQSQQQPRALREDLRQVLLGPDER